MQRRGFLGALGAVASSLAVGGAAGACARAESGGRALGPIGLQLYTVRSLMGDDVQGTLARVAGVGYDEVEFAGYFEHAPAALRRILDDHGLSAPSAHVPFDALDGDGWARAIDAAHVLGHRYLVIAWVPPEARITLDDYRRLTERFERAGEQAADAGLRFAYHNHEFEFEPIEGGVPYDILADADPAFVDLQLDLFWIRHAGRDPLEYFERHPGRFPLVHVKDMAPGGEMVDVGTGAIDWARIFAQAQRAGIRHYFVEHDEPADPISSITRSLNYLQRLEV